MDFEERERQRRRQMISVIIAEAGMFLAVVVIVVVATLAAMGFFVTPEGTIEQSGLVQIRSMPTGGSVELDGGVLFSRTNLTRSLTVGDHSIKITKDGYDTWEKTVKMCSGILIRLYYPRLFLNNRVPETMERLGQVLEFFEPSRDDSYILYAEKSSTKWQMLNIRGDDVRASVIDMVEVLPGVEGGIFTGEIVEFEWSENSDRVLIKVSVGGAMEWVLVDLRDTKKSLNLTRAFGLNFTQIKMIDESATQLFALENRQLRKISIADQAVSRVLLNGIENMAVEGTNVIYTMAQEVDGVIGKAIGVYKDGEKDGTNILQLEEQDKTKVVLAKYYDEDYVVLIVNDEVMVYYGTLPSYRERASELDYSNFEPLLKTTKLSMVPEGTSLSEKGEYVAMWNGKHFAVVDFEMGALYEYDVEADEVKWLSRGMMFTTNDGKLEVWDFDYTNRRVLVEMAKEDKGVVQNLVATQSDYAVANYAATISYNNKWLYYVVDNSGELVLRREKIRD